MCIKSLSRTKDKTPRILAIHLSSAVKVANYFHTVRYMIDFCGRDQYLNVRAMRGESIPAQFAQEKTAQVFLDENFVLMGDTLLLVQLVSSPRRSPTSISRSSRAVR